MGGGIRVRLCFCHTLTRAKPSVNMPYSKAADGKLKIDLVPTGTEETERIWAERLAESFC